MKNIIGRGAEAVLFLEDGKLVKERIPKSYRLKEIDDLLRKSRTRSEAKILAKLEGMVPTVYETDETRMSIVMEHLDGRLLRDILDSQPRYKQKKMMREIGRIVGVFHSKDIIHGDLTTSNMIEMNDKIFFIDFGLGFISTKAEDKAVDLHVLKQALESKHYRHAEDCYRWFLEGYRSWAGSKDILERLEKVERRGRYKRKAVN